MTGLCDSACCVHKIADGRTLHFWNFGSRGKTACKLPVWDNCEPECSNCSHKVNLITMYLEDVTCPVCKLAALKQFGIDNILEAAEV